MSWSPLNNTGCKYGLGSGATGSWARDVHMRVIASQEQARERALLQDQLLIGGIKAKLWRSATSGVVCSCYKESTQQADRKCTSCHGVVDGYVPGYLRFGFDTLWMSPVDTDVTLTDVEVTTTWHSSKAQLSSTVTTGTIESGDKAFSRSAIGSQWEYQVEELVRSTSDSSVVTEYSLDSGASWSDISALVAANPSSGTIRFRVTLNRDSTNVISPLFSIMRARYETIDASEDGRSGAWILVLRDSPKETAKKSDYGDIPDQGSLILSTAGLGMFNPAIELGSDAELLKGPGIVIELMEGALTGSRYVVTGWKLIDPMGYKIVNQEFSIRLNDPSGHYSLIW